MCYQYYDKRSLQELSVDEHTANRLEPASKRFRQLTLIVTTRDQHCLAMLLVAADWYELTVRSALRSHLLPAIVDKCNCDAACRHTSAQSQPHQLFTPQSAAR